MEEGATDQGPPSARLDLDRLLEISGGDTEFERELVADYLEQAWALFEAGTRALEGRDAATLRRVAQTLKRISETIGAGGVARVAATLEAVSAKSMRGAAPLLGRALACLIATEREFERYFGTEGGRKAA